MASRRTRRDEERRGRTPKQRQPRSPEKTSIFDKVSTDWIVGGMVVGIMVVAALVFLFGQVFSRGGGSSRPFFNQVFSTSVSPDDARIRLLADVSGLYRSDDGGNDWDRVTPENQAVYSVLNVPSQPNSFILGGDGLFQRSDDGGKTWRDIPNNLPSLKLRSLAIEPAGGGTMYAFLDNDGLYRSDDGGQSWSQVAAIQDATITSLAVKPGAPEVLYAFNTRRGLVRSADGAREFSAVGGGIPSSSVSSVLTFPSSPETVFAIAARTIFRSTDDGVTWKRSSEGLDSTLQLVALARDSASGDLYAVDAQGSYYLSADGGASWATATGAARTGP